MAQEKSRNIPAPGRNPEGQSTNLSQAAGNNPTQIRPETEGGGNLKTFRCADVGNADCRWEVSGRTADELMPQIERHGREAHNIQNIDDNLRRKIRDNIRERQAA